VGRCPNRVPVPTLGTGGGGRALTSPPHQGALQQWIDKLPVRELLIYQPAGRYWAFRWYETSIFLGLAPILAGFCFWWIRGRLS
jgi:hypothetical protein